jgi:hypothetical protein
MNSHCIARSMDHEDVADTTGERSDNVQCYSESIGYVLLHFVVQLNNKMQ